MNSKSTVPLFRNRMPVIGFGTWQLDDAPAETILHAFELGYRLIDTSSDYGTQAAVGEAMKKSGIPREEMYLITKVEEDDDAYLVTEKYLAEIGVDYTDFMLIHHPPEEGVGEDLWKGLIKARIDGLIRDIGVSNYSIQQMEELFEATGEKPAVNQIEWSPFGYSEEMLEYCREHEIVLQAYSPLTRGKLLKEPVLLHLAEKYHKSAAQILIRWNLQKEVVSIPKANNPEHLKENIQVFDFKISNHDMNLLNSLNQEFSALSGLAYMES